LTFPYGVILFSLWGAETIPEVEEAAGGSKKIMKWAIISSILLSALIYLLFIFFVLGVSGAQTSTDAISGILSILDGRILSLGYIFGILTCFTSFLTLGLVLKKTLWQDLNLNKNLSWILACFSPLVLFLLGFREFLDIIGLSGALSIGFEGIMIVFLYRKFLRQKLSAKMNFWGWLLPLLFLAGMAFEIYYFFFTK
jgi:amino acid permease